MPAISNLDLITAVLAWHALAEKMPRGAFATLTSAPLSANSLTDRLTRLADQPGMAFAHITSSKAGRKSAARGASTNDTSALQGCRTIRFRQNVQGKSS